MSIFHKYTRDICILLLMHMLNICGMVVMTQYIGNHSQLSLTGHTLEAKLKHFDILLS